MLVTTILVLLAAGCDSGGAVGEGSVKDKVPPAEYPTVPQGNHPRLSRLRHDGEIAVAGTAGLFAIDPKTGQTRKLAGCSSPCEYVGGFAWSPDGTQIAYTVGTCVSNGACESAAGIWVKQAGEAPRQLTTRCNPTLMPPCAGEVWEWSPTGDLLAYSRTVETGGLRANGTCCSNQGRESELSLLDPSDGRLTALTQGSGGISAVDWSPDGAEIAFGDGSGISVISPVNGSYPREIARNVGSVDSVVWSPDGAQIAFDTFQGDSSRIYVMNADGSARRQLADGAKFEGPGAPVWSPDSTRIAYVATPGKQYAYGVQFFVVSADGSKRTAIYDSGCCPNPYFDGPVWSPDGAQIAYKGVAAKWRVARADGAGRASPVDNLVIEGWQQRPGRG